MRHAILFIALMSILAPASYASEPVASFKFRTGMHELFKNYRNIYIATNEGNHEAAAAHVRLSREYIKQLGEHLPEKDADKEKIDKSLFMMRLDSLGRQYEKLAEALKEGAQEEIKELPKTIFTICSGCHTEAKLKYMFRLPQGQKLIGQYMHSVRENYDMASIYLESGDRERGSEHIFIANEYLSVLRKVFPSEGPSGVIMSRAGMEERIKEIERLNAALQREMKDGKDVDFGPAKKSLRMICVSCHEPDMIE
ncbi:MAG: hypothetical protein OEZ04_13965 [Nitrospinota bacterium]|nr:hypothetical protein [Nitrospinota bacterium]